MDRKKLIAIQQTLTLASQDVLTFPLEQGEEYMKRVLKFGQKTGVNYIDLKEFERMSGKDVIAIMEPERIEP